MMVDPIQNKLSAIPHQRQDMKVLSDDQVNRAKAIVEYVQRAAALKTDENGASKYHLREKTGGDVAAHLNRSDQSAAFELNLAAREIPRSRDMPARA
jgi:hypothetical protein